MNLRTFVATLSLLASAATFGCGDSSNSTTPVPLVPSERPGAGGMGGTGGMGGMGGGDEGPLTGESYGGKGEAPCDAAISSADFFRTELFFGLSRSGGPDITEAEFAAFVDAEVTPRFPAGLTLLQGRGQYRADDGTLTREGSKVLVLLHGGSADEMAKIEAIRAKYKEQFTQESVLRTDSFNCVAF